MNEPRIDRRRFLYGAALATMAGRAGRASAATSPEWDQTVAAAKKEGKVAVNTFTGQGYGRVLKLFAQAYPEIKVDHTNLEPVDFSPRIINERKAGVYTWDVVTMPTSTALQVLRPAGVFDPIRPAIIAPDAKNDASWRGGFDAGFLDKDRRLAYARSCARPESSSTSTESRKASSRASRTCSIPSGRAKSRSPTRA